MTASTMVPIVGSIIKGDIGNSKENGSVHVLTPTGLIVIVERPSILASQVVQSGSDPSQSLYRVFVGPDAELSIKVRAAAWAQVDSAMDVSRAALRDSGGSKRIEDTA